MRLSFTPLIASLLAIGAITAMPAAQAATLYGLQDNADFSNSLVSFNSASPGSVTTIGAISNLASGDYLLGMDVQASTGNLYALSGFGYVYRLDTGSGAATQVSATALPLFNGFFYGVDFDAAGHLRVTSDGPDNVSIDVATGSMIGTDGTLAYAAGDVHATGFTPQITGSAYDSHGTLYGIDSFYNALVVQDPSTGLLNTVGATGVGSFDERSGFDIVDGVGYVAMTGSDGFSDLYTVDLTTGAMTLQGAIGSGVLLEGLSGAVSVAAVPEPSTWALLLIGGLGMVHRVRRSRRG